MSKLRVLQVVGALRMGGIEKYVMDLFRCTDRDRVEFHALTQSPGDPAYEREAECLGVRLWRCSGPANYPAYVRKVRRILIQQGPFNALHSHSRFGGLFIREAHRAGIPVRIDHVHNTNRSFSRLDVGRRAYVAMVNRWVRRYATHGFAVSQAVGDSIWGTWWRADRRFSVVSAALDWDAYDADINSYAVRNELGVAQQSRVVMHTGRFVRQKNHARILDIFERVLESEPGAVLVLVGDGPVRTNVEEQVVRMGLEERVYMTGHRNDVPRLLMGLGEVLLFPSLYEGLGLSVVEAQAAGLCCVVSEAVPSEAEVIPALIRRRSLQDANGAWAQSVLDCLWRQRRQPQAHCLARVRQTGFNIQVASQRLLDVYAAGGQHAE